MSYYFHLKFNIIIYMLQYVYKHSHSIKKFMIINIIMMVMVAGWEGKKGVYAFLPPMSRLFVFLVLQSTPVTRYTPDKCPGPVYSVFPGLSPVMLVCIMC